MTGAQPCKRCLFWYSGAGFGDRLDGKPGLSYCELLDNAPSGSCDKALFPLARELWGFPPIRITTKEPA